MSRKNDWHDKLERFGRTSCLTVLAAAGLAVIAGVGISSSPAYAQSDAQVQRINKWFDDQKNKQKNSDEYWKKQHSGPLQTPGEIQQSGTIQKAGAIQKAGTLPIPTGWNAIKDSTLPCQRRFVLCGDTLFEFNKATLTQDAVKTLQLLLPELVKQRTHPVSIEGHTDGIGTDEYNMDLSNRRAQTVQNWLLATRIFTAEAVKVEGFGERKPVAPNNHADGSDNPEGRQKNRRVEIVINTCVTFQPEQADATAGGATPLDPANSTTTADSTSISSDTGSGSTDKSAQPGPSSTGAPSEATGTESE